MKNKILYVATLALLSFSSCTKVINIDLNATNPQLVVDGLVSDRAGVPDTVKLSETVNYFAQSVYPAISGARVVISDNTGISDTLKEMTSQPGTYITSTLQGIPGRTYTLTIFSKAINTSGQTYTASSTMPQPVNIDSIGQMESFQKRFRPGGGGPDSSYNITVHWKDPAGVSNYYRLNYYYNDTLAHRSSYNIVNDKYSDGLEFDYPLTHSFKPGDSARVELWCIDLTTYNYYVMLNGIVGGQNGPNSASPTNPLSNVSTGAVGYFTAYSVTSMPYKIK